MEPFFFSSSLNWIPSRYQENVQPKGRRTVRRPPSWLFVLSYPVIVDITVTLTFLRCMGKKQAFYFEQRFHTHGQLIEVGWAHDLRLNYTRGRRPPATLPKTKPSTLVPLRLIIFHQHRFRDVISAACRLVGSLPP